jgi:hypothetical protein
MYVEPDVMVLAVGRAAERLIVDAMFGVSLILGWNLFRVGIVNEQSAEASGIGWKVRLQKVGPGVFFALFGSIGLVVALQRPLDIKTSNSQTGATSEVSSATGQTNGVLEYVEALTTVESLGIPDNGSHSVTTDALLKAKPILERQRQALLKAYWKDAYDWYLGVKSDPLRKKHLTPAELDTFEKIDRSASDSFATNAQ